MRLNDIRSLAMGALTLAIATALSKPASAQWTQWGGPRRDFTADGSALKDKWPDGGPPQLWKRELGDSYGTILVDGETLFVGYRVGPDEFFAALDAHTGKTKWEHKNNAPTTPTMDEYGGGPHSTPLVVGDKLYAVGTNMIFWCLDKNSGKVVWQHDLVKEFEATVPGRGYSSSPLLYKDTIILPVDPKGGHSLVAFHRESGSMVWKHGEFGTTESSPFLIKFGGEDQLVYFTGDALAGFNPDSGEPLWSVEHKTQYGANLMTPHFDGKDKIFCSAAYDSGARVVQLSKTEGKTTAKELWFSRKMRLHHGNALGIEGVVYGSSGDFGPAFFMAIDIDDGKVLWRERGFKKATFLHAGGKFLILDEDGQLALATASPDKLTVISQAKVAETYAWAAPTLVGTRLYVRDRKHIMAFELG